ncbi:PLP-dependent aminotransferase family protein [Rhodobacteraceae bacterium RKSG542]|uniref:MocR-like pyridoxine biosynthesis transcription factor PdxR n=1 Tax=Pseudovibrio flavus TaxID=2529854 RepID=UPI0012BC7771|nr:PLP-dependent aminotransferase family protein [Pseudovibrio flavus]MTI19134.1 PLP-dependent aminotransferase family protein [Pseudovibrio flavus]
MIIYELQLDRESGVPLSSQIYRYVREGVAGGKLKAGALLPSSRQLASVLGISRNTVNTAYELLKAEALIDVRRGAAPVVCEQPSAFSKETTSSISGSSQGLSKRGKRLSADLRFPSKGEKMQPGEPARSLFPYDLWGRSLRRAARTVGDSQLAYEHTFGLDRLRSVLAQYLLQERGVRAEAEQIIVGASVQSLLTLITQSFSDEGDPALIEEPGYTGARSAFHAAGLDVQGFDPSEGLSSFAGKAFRLIYLTPSHQFPLGMRMDMARRLEVLQFARKSGALVIEDDYDSEFLFEGRPLAALQGLNAGSDVVYIGTVSKSLAPGIRLAYAVVPRCYAKALRVAHRSLGGLANVHGQAALAHFIEEGHYRAHLKKIRRAYEERGALLSAEIRRVLGNRVGVGKPAGGLQMPIFLPQDCDDQYVASQLDERGFGVKPLSSYYIKNSSRVRRMGLVCGFAEVDEATARLFAETLDKLVPASP